MLKTVILLTIYIFYFKKFFDVKNQMQHLFETEIFYRVSNQIFVCCESN